jgi:homoserine O-acetyltransferase
MLSYKSADLFNQRFGRAPNRNGEDPWGLDDHGGGLIGGRFDIAGYLDHQGDRFINRFDANAYLAILRMMDTWDPVRGHPSPAQAFAPIRARLTFIGISSDWLFPPQSVRALASRIQSAGVHADYRAHDAFLAEQAELARLLQ